MKPLESDYPGPESPVLRPIHRFAPAISKAFSGRRERLLPAPEGQGFQDELKATMTSCL
jgi:hypothetical protein